MAAMKILQALRGAQAGKGQPVPAISLAEFTLEATSTHRILAGELEVAAPIVFAPRLELTVATAAGVEHRFDSADNAYLAWLPRGRYRFTALLPASLPAGACELRLVASHHAAMAYTPVAERKRSQALAAASGGPQSAQWSFESVPPTTPIESLGWKKGHGDWFFRHFDHAATTVISYLLGDSPLLRERILDVGCGDGITDLGVALRTGCRKFVGIDPFRQFERLPGILADNHLPADLVPPTLTFMAEDANFLPFEDDSFEVVISWGSVEHMAGGYLNALREVKRVLVPDGLFLVAPGLYYSNIGHHLDEFSKEPFFHLKMKEEDLKKMVLETPPRYIDRSGEFATNEQYWQWYTELNRITVNEFEKQLRALEFEPWRVALRTQDLVEYTPELQPYSIDQLTHTELYMSTVNRKRRRP